MLTFQTASFRRNSCHCAGPKTLSVQRLQNTSRVNRSRTSTTLLHGAHKLQEVTVYTKWTPKKQVATSALKQVRTTQDTYAMLQVLPKLQLFGVKGRYINSGLKSLCMNDLWMFQTLPDFIRSLPRDEEIMTAKKPWTILTLTQWSQLVSVDPSSPPKASLQ